MKRRIVMGLLILWAASSAYAANSYTQQYEDAVRKAIEEHNEQLKEGESQGQPGRGEILPQPEQGPAPLPTPASPPPANIYR